MTTNELTTAVRTAWRELELLKIKKRKLLRPFNGTSEEFYQAHKHIIEALPAITRLDFLSEYMKYYIAYAEWYPIEDFDKWLCEYLFRIDTPILRALRDYQSDYTKDILKMMKIYQASGYIFFRHEPPKQSPEPYIPYINRKPAYLGIHQWGTTHGKQNFIAGCDPYFPPIFDGDPVNFPILDDDSPLL